MYFFSSKNTYKTKHFKNVTNITYCVDLTKELSITFSELADSKKLKSNKRLKRNVYLIKIFNRLGDFLRKRDVKQL